MDNLITKLQEIEKIFNSIEDLKNANPSDILLTEGLDLNNFVIGVKSIISNIFKKDSTKLQKNINEFNEVHDEIIELITNYSKPNDEYDDREFKKDFKISYNRLKDIVKGLSERVKDFRDHIKAIDLAFKTMKQSTN